LPQIAESHAAGNFIESLVVTATSESPGVRASKNLAPCSKCGGKMCVSSTRKKVRYLKCSGCGRTDKVAC
jgi:ssDNA-binding Zn-finger/Zn-ribbon topoisomerase 1